jgi:CDP-diacylglycerol--serine O-phosphatidyltransferase
VLFLLHLSSIDKSLRLWALALPPLMLLIAILMVSTERYPSGKTLDLQTKARLQFLVGFVVLIGLVVLFKEYAMVCACLGYIFYGLIRQWRRPARPKTAANSM